MPRGFSQVFDSIPGFLDLDIFVAQFLQSCHSFILKDGEALNECSFETVGLICPVFFHSSGKLSSPKSCQMVGCWWLSGDLFLPILSFMFQCRLCEVFTSPTGRGSYRPPSKLPWDALCLFSFISFSPRFCPELD